MESSITVSTDREVASLRPSTDGKVVWAVVEGCPGLRVRVTAGRKGASRAFCYRYKTPDGRLEMKVIGHYQIPGFGLREARAQWREWRELREIRETHGYVKAYVAQERAQNVAAIEATTKQTDRDTYTVAVLAREFVDFQSAKIKTWRETQRNLNVYVLPEIGDRPANGVRRKDVLEILDGLTRKGNTVTANRVLAAARAMFNWAIQREKAAIESNPCIAIKPQKEQARERALSDVELRRLLVNAPDSTLTSDERDLLEFILLTACRLSEATGARLDEFDIEAALWALPAARSKNGRAHRLPLSKQCLALVQRRASTFLFPMSGDDKRPMRSDYIHQPLREAMAALKVLVFTPHDLRRSAASGIAALGASRDVVRRILNHTDPTVTARYDRSDHTPEMRQWLQAWADHLDGLRGATVTKMKRQK